MSLHDYTLYALVKRDTFEPACRMHRSSVSTWKDSSVSFLIGVNESTILERLEDGEITGDDGEVYKIVRLRIETWDLDPDDESEIKRVAEGYEKLAAEMRQRYGGSDK